MWFIFSAFLWDKLKNNHFHKSLILESLPFWKPYACKKNLNKICKKIHVKNLWYLVTAIKIFLTGEILLWDVIRCNGFTDEVKKNRNGKHRTTEEVFIPLTGGCSKTNLNIQSANCLIVIGRQLYSIRTNWCKVTNRMTWSCRQIKTPAKCMAVRFTKQEIEGGKGQPVQKWRLTWSDCVVLAWMTPTKVYRLINVWKKTTHWRYDWWYL